MHVDATPKRMPSKVKEEHLPEEHLCSAEAHFHKGLRQFQLLHDEHGNPQKDKFRLGKEQVLEGMLRLGEVFGSNDRWNQVEAWTFQNFQTVRKHNISLGCPDIVLVFFRSFGDEYGVCGFIFSFLFGSSNNRPKSIAIFPESLISHFGIWNI